MCCPFSQPPADLWVFLTPLRTSPFTAELADFRPLPSAPETHSPAEPALRKPVLEAWVSDTQALRQQQAGSCNNLPGHFLGRTLRHPVFHQPPIGKAIWSILTPRNADKQLTLLTSIRIHRRTLCSSLLQKLLPHPGAGAALGEMFLHPEDTPALLALNPARMNAPAVKGSQRPGKEYSKSTIQAVPREP